jgi:CBS domain-containing protein
MSDERSRLPVAGQVCTPNFLAVPRRRRVVEVAHMMAERWASAAIVTEERRPVGIVTRRTLIKDVLARGYTGMELTAGDVMHYPISSVGADTPLETCAALMAEGGLRHLAVVDEGGLVGLLSDYQVARLIPALVDLAQPAGSVIRRAPPAGCAAPGDPRGED